MDKKHNCKGCASLQDGIDCELYNIYMYGGTRYILDEKEIGEYMKSCPCSKCLVKSLCEEGCKDYYSFIESIPFEKFTREKWI